MTMWILNLKQIIDGNYITGCTVAACTQVISVRIKQIDIKMMPNWKGGSNKNCYLNWELGQIVINKNKLNCSKLKVKFISNKNKVTVESIQKNKDSIAKIDFGATRLYFKKKHSTLLLNLSCIKNGSVATLRNKIKIVATHKKTHKMHPCLSNITTTTLVYPQLKSESLISVGQFCDNDYAIICHRQV